MAEKKEAKKISKSAMYDVSTGVLKRKNKFCPKCGPGVFLAEHKERVSCGNCGYMETKKK
ncbi:MAG: 30S ribosomal protein S27ae [archaeon]